MSQVTDTFTRSGSIDAAAMDSGHTWTLQTQGPYNGNTPPGFITPGTSDIDITSNQAHGGTGTGVAGRYNRATVDHGTADIDVTLDAILPIAQGTGVSIIFRWEGTDDHWDLVLYRSLVGAGAYSALLRKWDGYANPSVEDSLGVLTSGATGTHSLRVVADGLDITAYLDSSSLFTHLGDGYNLTATHHGIGCYLGDSGTLLDNYNADPLGQNHTVGMVRMN